MNLFVISQMKLISSLFDNDDYLDVLLTVADFLDLTNLFVFPNWEDADVIDCKFMKYYTYITLRASYDKMPHPKGALVLTKYGCQVKYHETKEAVLKQLHSLADTYYDWDAEKRRRKVVKRKVWEIEIMIPNKFLFPDDITIEELQRKAQEGIEDEQAMTSLTQEEPEIEDLEKEQADFDQTQNQGAGMSGPAPGAVPTAGGQNPM